MPKFRTQFDPAPDIAQNPGSPVKVLYAPKYDQNGIWHLEEIGKHDLYGEIQSHAASVDIHVLLAMYQNGDIGALARVQGAYGDFTQMPTTFAEALNTLLAAEQYFDGLPKDVRAGFNNDFHQFIATMDMPDWSSKLGIAQPGLEGLLNTPQAPSEPSPTPDTPPVSPAPTAPPTAS